MNQESPLAGRPQTKLLVTCEVGAGDPKRLDAVADGILSLAGESWRCMETCWLLLTDLRAVVVRDFLKRDLMPNDRLLVALLSDHAAWHGFEESAHQDWLLAQL